MDLVLAKYASARGIFFVNSTMLSVVSGFFLYELTHSTTWLALAGLVQFLPRLFFSLPAGTIADTRDRRQVIAICQCLIFLTAFVYALLIFTHLINAWICLFLIFLYGTGFAIQGPSSVSLLPNIVKRKDFASATATVTSVVQITTIGGPALAGFLYIFGPEVPLFLITATSLLAATIVLSIRPRQIHRDLHTAGLSKEEIRAKRKAESPLAGLKYIWENPGILGALSLDMFAVLFGGVTALLPVFADEVLHTGSVGLGFLRAAPAFGAFMMSAFLSRHPLKHAMGKKMFATVAVWGTLTIIFALSTNIILSVIILVFLGSADVISVVIRSTYVQLKTPDEMRGRVSAVNLIFIGASNQLGEFESGMVATAFGQNVVAATIFGGCGTLLVVAIWFAKFKELRELDHL